MNTLDYFVFAGVFICGIVMLVESVAYFRRGVYTKTFKGTSRREYIHKNEKPIEYWFSVAFHFSAGIAMLYVVFWLFYPRIVAQEWFSHMINLSRT